MDMFGWAVLRYPASLAAASGITASLFWGLWSFSDKSFEVVEATPFKIDFTRVERPETLETKNRVKPVRPLIEDELQIMPPTIGATGIDIGPGVAWQKVPVVDLPGIGEQTAGRDMAAAPVLRINPTYPPREADRGTEGWVRVQFDITATGAVTNVIAVESEPGSAFDKAAVDAVARWRYNPSVANGQAIERAGMQTLIRFTLEDAQ